MFAGVVGVKDLDALWKIQAAKVGGDVACSDFITCEYGADIESAGVDINQPLLQSKRNVALSSEKIYPFEFGGAIAEEQDDVVPGEEQIHVNLLEGRDFAFD